MHNEHKEKKEIFNIVEDIINKKTRILTLNKIFEKISKELKVLENKEEYKFTM